MTEQTTFGRPTRRTFLTASVIGAAAVGGALPGYAAPQSVNSWIERHARKLRTTVPGAPLSDLGHLRGVVGGAKIVALGEAVHSTAEISRLKHRVLRYLVEELGFRSIAWEDDWTLGLQLNEYVQTGRGDLRALMAEMSTAWQYEEVADVLEYLRDYNAKHRDKVRFTGVEYWTTRHLAYNAIDSYVARHAPGRLAELREHLNPLRPNKPTMGQYVGWYWGEVKNKEPYIRNAEAVLALVQSLRHRPGDRAWAVVEHHARQIHSFYEGFSLEDNYAYRDARAAENLRWWERFNGGKIVYWAASAHTANTPDLRVSRAPLPDVVFPSAGSYLRRWYGRSYRSLGFTFDHGSLYSPQQPVPLPPASIGWFERSLAEVDTRTFTVDLRHPASGPAAAWLHGPLTTRGFPEAGPTSTMRGNTLAEWFDHLIHTQQVSPAHPLPPR